MNDFYNSVSTFFADCFSMGMVMILVENMIFSRALGTSTALVVIRKKNSLVLFSTILTTIIVLSAILTYYLEPLVSFIPNAGYFRPVIYIAVISAVYLAALIVCSRFSSGFQKKIKPMIHITAFNSVVLGTLLLIASGDYSIGSAIGFGLGSGIGFGFAMFFISVAYDYLYSTAIPKAFRGFPILLIYIGLLSLAVYGLFGHQLPY